MTRLVLHPEPGATQQLVLKPSGRGEATVEALFKPGAGPWEERFADLCEVLPGHPLHPAYLLSGHPSDPVSGLHYSRGGTWLHVHAAPSLRVAAAPSPRWLGAVSRGCEVKLWLHCACMSAPRGGLLIDEGSELAVVVLGRLIAQASEAARWLAWAEELNFYGGMLSSRQRRRLPDTERRDVPWPDTIEPHHNAQMARDTIITARQAIRSCGRPLNCPPQTPRRPWPEGAWSSAAAFTADWAAKDS